jgi:hypothetical protein
VIRHTRTRMNAANVAAGLIAGAIVCTSSPCFAGSLADTTARLLSSARPSRAARVAPISLNLHPSASAILSLSRPRALDQSSAQKVPVAEFDGRESEPGPLNLHAAFPIKWESTPANVNPRIVSLARNFRHNGLPIVHLWGSGRNLLALGLNPHGKPGIYFTQNMD